MPRTTSLLLVLLALVLGACTAGLSVGDRYFEGGEYQQAAAAYQASLVRETDRQVRDRTFYRLGILYAIPGSTAFDPDRAIEALETLLEESPASAYRVEATVLMDLLIGRRELERDLETRQDLVVSLTRELARLQGEVQRVEGEAGEREETVLEMSERIDRLRREISFLASEVSRREQELERLKAIDLEGPP